MHKVNGLSNLWNSTQNKSSAVLGTFILVISRKTLAWLVNIFVNMLTRDKQKDAIKGKIFNA